MILEWVDIYSKNLRVWSMGLAEYLVFICGAIPKKPLQGGVARSDGVGQILISSPESVEYPVA
jgi:hypothetical protein